MDHRLLRAFGLFLPNKNTSGVQMSVYDSAPLSVHPITFCWKSLKACAQHQQFGQSCFGRLVHRFCQPATVRQGAVDAGLKTCLGHLLLVLKNLSSLKISLEGGAQDSPNKSE